MRIKKMSEQEFNGIMKRNWIPVKIEKDAQPDWMKNIPDEKVVAIYGSGSLSEENPEADGNITMPTQVGGIDVYRYAEEKDGVSINKDWYRVFIDPNDDSQLLIQGPINDDEHWIDAIPERLKYCEVVKKE